MNKRIITFTKLYGNHIENKFKTDNFFFATLYSFFKCPRMLNKLWRTNSNCKVRYQIDGTSFGEVFIEESEDAECLK